ncbi:MAG: gamma-glutamyl-gamma-aminobutyrate hydrolase family protein [Vulcanimicrobiaceae bacterium]
MRAYGTAVERAGGSPAYVVSNATRIAEYLAEFDGFVLSGGVDIEPTRYGGQRLASVDEAVPARDEFELALVPELIDCGAPTLAICRGLQAVNVALGGSLIEDLPTDLGERYRIKHQQSKELALARDSYAPQHEVRLEPQSALAQLLGLDRFLTNSMHHQASRSIRDSDPDIARVSSRRTLAKRESHPERPRVSSRRPPPRPRVASLIPKGRADFKQSASLIPKLVRVLPRWLAAGSGSESCRSRSARLRAHRPGTRSSVSSRERRNPRASPISLA